MIFKTDYGSREPPPVVRGKVREIACQTWTTVEGKLTPLMFKMEDEDGIIQKFDRITLNFAEVKEYAGTISHEFDCYIIVNGLKVNVILQLCPKTLKWYLVEKQIQTNKTVTSS